MIAFRLSCRDCGWHEWPDRDAIISRLRLVGVLRREREADDDLLAELLPSAAERMTCPTCKRRGLAATPSEGGEDDGDWQDAVLCEVCRRPIPAERLAALPDASRCVDCQDATEQGVGGEDEPEFCPRCGAPIEIRVGHGAGITRYKRFCTGDPPCRL